jgi:secreted PhoX family phosphatase
MGHLVTNFNSDPDEEGLGGTHGPARRSGAVAAAAAYRRGKRPARARPHRGTPCSRSETAATCTLVPILDIFSRHLCDTLERVVLSNEQLTDVNSMDISRRHFLRNCGFAAAALLGLGNFSDALSVLDLPETADGLGYGPLVLDPNRVVDLPKGFSYRVISKAGERMEDGLLVPGKHDGMAAFPGPQGKTILIRNHEVAPGKTRYGPYGWFNHLLKNLADEQLYDPGGRRTPGLGGTTTLVYDTRSQHLEKHFLSLAGTHNNCAGGATPWNSWISCEETVVGKRGSIEKDHGYNFEVPATYQTGLARPLPLKAMGRFNHEAVAVDPRTSIVYQTEDRADGLFYRFVPDMPGKLAAGGRLQALAIKGSRSLDTRNWGLGARISVGQNLAVEWVDLKNTDSPSDDLRLQGFANGCARFACGEGMSYRQGSIFFTCTSGGSAQKGQIWKLTPSAFEGMPDEKKKPGYLELFIEASHPNHFQNADSITVSPRGELYVCEDNAKQDHIVGVTQNGTLFKFAKNAMNDSEFAGAVFSPDGSTLFVNIQTPGLTLAITGKW